jgi:hypothetical protein
MYRWRKHETAHGRIARGARSEDALNSLSFEMRHVARKEIQHEVTGLTADRIHELWVAADGLEKRDQPAVTTEDRLAAVRRSELKRLWSMMTASGWETYSPENDPAVEHWQQESEKRANGEVPGGDQGQGRRAMSTPEIRAACAPDLSADPRRRMGDST